MPRKRHNRDNRSYHSRGHTRSASDSHSPSLRVRVTPTLEFLRPTEVLSTLTDVEDFRTWTPHRVRRPKTVRGSYAGVSGSGDPPPRKIPPRSHIRNFFRRLKFEASQFTLVCIRRNVRREIAHAFKFAGKGKRKRKPRYNRFSKVRC